MPAKRPERKQLPVDPVPVLSKFRRQGLDNAQTSSRDTGVLLLEFGQGFAFVGGQYHFEVDGPPR